MKKANNNNNLRTINDHYTEEMRDYVMDLWMQGRSKHVIERLICKKLSERYHERVARRAEKKAQKSA